MRHSASMSWDFVKTMNPQNTPHSSPFQTSYGAYFLISLQKNTARYRECTVIASEVTPKDMGKINWYMSKTKHHKTWTPNIIIGMYGKSMYMMTSSNANIFRVTGNSPVTGEFPAQMPVTRSWYFLYMLLNKLLSKRSRGWWFETSSRSLWRPVMCPKRNASTISSDHLWYTQ